MPVYYEQVLKMIRKVLDERERRGEKLDLTNKINLVQQFRTAVRDHHDFPALKTRTVGTDGAVSWVAKTYGEFAEIVNVIAAALLGEGVKKGERITLQSHTREEWTLVDEAILGTGCVVVCAYPSLAEAVVEYQINDSDTTIAFVETRRHVETLIKLKPKLPSLRLCIVIDDPRAKQPEFNMPTWCITLAEFMERGKKALGSDAGFKERIERLGEGIDPDDLATIVYTSGTTGMPKGAMLTHWNIVSDVKMVLWFAPVDLTRKTNLSFLPLSHVLERMAGHFYPISIGMCTAFASDIDNLSRDLQEIKPEYLTGVPRVFEKIYAFAMQTIKDYTPTKQKIFWWAVEVGKQFDTAFRASKGEKAPIVLKVKIKIARKLVFDKFLEKTGGRLLFFVSGGASLPLELAKFYGAVGVTIVEGYGLTETAPVTNMNDPLDVVYGTVGPPLPGTEIKIADDDEILIRGPQVFKGYWKKPEQTAAVLETDGWFHTGDLGKLDDKGNLKIIGRKKEIFVLSTGKKVPPIIVEELVSTTEFIQQLVLEGDGKKFISALVTPNFPSLAQHVKKHLPAIKMPDIASASNTEVRQFLGLPEIKALFEKDIKKINSLVDPFMQIKQFQVLPMELTEETGDLTPSLKFKRRAIADHYRDLIDAMYDKDTSVELSDNGVQITEK